MKWIKFNCLAIGITLAFIFGCSMEAGPVSGPDISYCKDTRDGELFSFRIEDVRDAVVTLHAGGCFTVVDNKGLERRLCSADESWLKCRAIPFEDQ